MSLQHYFQFTLLVMCKFPISIFDFPYLHLIQNHNLRGGFDKHFYQQQRRLSQFINVEFNISTKIFI